MRFPIHLKPASMNGKSGAIRNQILRQWQDFLIVAVLAIAAGIAAYQASQSDLITQFDNVWFSSDTGRSFGSMVWHDGNHSRTSVHPLFVFFTLPLTYILRKIGHLEPYVAVKLLLSSAAMLWTILLFALFRFMGCRRPDAVLLTLVGATSAAAYFWFTVPETYPFGTLTILLALCFVVLTQTYSFSIPWYIGISAATLSITVTNWMVGLLATIVNHRWKRTVVITVGAVLVVQVLTVLQKQFFHSAAILGAVDKSEESKFLLDPLAGGPFRVGISFLFHTMVMPAISFGPSSNKSNVQEMSVQYALPGSASAWGLVAALAWVGLLGLGIWAMVTLRQHQKLRIVVGISLLGQLGLHILYGDQTFLYALHFLPLLLAIAALSMLTRLRPLALILAGILVLTAGINNGAQLQEARQLIQLHSKAEPGSERIKVRLQMYQHPDNLWPRSQGHVVLAAPGSLEVNKAYHEPGGSFSPSVKSFGVSLWMVDPTGKPKLTSDTIPLEKIRQQFVWQQGQNIPGIATQADAYQTLWSATGEGQWQLALSSEATAEMQPAIAIRSVGPAGGAIRSLKWENQTLKIGDRWFVSITPNPAHVYLGDETTPNWMTEQPTATEWQDDKGWGYAHLELGSGKKWTLTIQDTNFQTKPELASTPTKSLLELDLPDPQFRDSLNAQVAHITMGLVGKQPRPGDPTTYPLPWQRDAAYEVVALARAGQVDLAKQLATELAERDFYGGFGSEADAPGLAIWALESIAAQLNSPEYDRWLWQHIHRKAQIILEMLTADKPLRREVTAPILPHMKDNPDRTLVAEAAKDGLIIGRMDGHRPILFVNAVSYRGLLDAASLADRVGQKTEAEQWRVQATQLKQAWQQAFKPPESENDRTYISSLWNTWIATDSREALSQGLQTRWNQLRTADGGFKTTPFWTYFDLAEAHQWLFLGKPDLAWKTMRWFWNHQASPGLYTWWEGPPGEESSATRWKKVRGWVYPPNVTPHYWTAAEMLMLQLDMLAYADQSASEPVLVIGAGVPAEWLQKPLAVKGLPVAGNTISWKWDGKNVYVQIRGAKKIPIRLGAGFPAQVPLQVEYVS